MEIIYIYIYVYVQYIGNVSYFLKRWNTLNFLEPFCLVFLWYISINFMMSFLLYNYLCPNAPVPYPQDSCQVPSPSRGNPTVPQPTSTIPTMYPAHQAAGPPCLQPAGVPNLRPYTMHNYPCPPYPTRTLCLALLKPCSLPPSAPT